MKDRTKEEIDTAHAIAIYHIGELKETVPRLDDSELEEIKRRLVDSFYEGVDYRESLADTQPNSDRGEK